MYTDDLVKLLIAENNKSFFCKLSERAEIKAAISKAYWDHLSAPSFFDDDLKSALSFISDKAAGLKYRHTLDLQTYFKNINRKEAQSYIDSLKSVFADKGRSFEVYTGRYSSKTAIFKINFLIKLAFDLQLSFEAFRKLAAQAGYYFNINTPYLPYYFLKNMLDTDRYDYGMYKKGLTNTENIKLLIDNELLSPDSFNKNDMQNYFQSHRGKYRMTFDSALKDLRFQADFISCFFNKVYISGEWTENRVIEL